MGKCRLGWPKALFFAFEFLVDFACDVIQCPRILCTRVGWAEEKISYYRPAYCVGDAYHLRQKFIRDC